MKITSEEINRPRFILTLEMTLEQAKALRALTGNILGDGPNRTAMTEIFYHLEALLPDESYDSIIELSNSVSFTSEKK